MTKDTAVVSVTNNIPVIVTIPDTIYTGINTNVDITVVATDDGPGIVYEFDFGNGFVVSDGDTTIKTQYTEEIKQVIVRVKDNDNNSVLDTFYISVRWLYTFNEFPVGVAGSLKSRGAYAICKLDNYVYIGGGLQFVAGGPPIVRKDLWRTADGENWEKIVDSLPWGAKAYYCFIRSETENAIYALGSLGSNNNVYKTANNGSVWDSVNNLSNVCDDIVFSTGEASNTYITILGGSAIVNSQTKCLTSPIYKKYSENIFDGGFSTTCQERKDVSTTIYNDTIWFAAGRPITGDAYDDMWFIKTGAYWPEERIATNKFSKSYGGALFFVNEVMIYAPQNPKEIWYSKDRGRNWEMLNISVPWHLDGTIILDGFSINSKMLYFSVRGVYVSDNCP